MIFLAPALAIALTAHGPGAGERSGHGIIVGLGDGVELVIVATRAPEGESHRGASEGVDLVVDAVEEELLAVALVQVHRPEGEETGGDEVLGLGPGSPASMRSPAICSVRNSS